MNVRSRLIIVLVVAMIIFAAGVWLRLEAHALCTRLYHLPGTSGTDLNASFTDEYHYEGLVEIARLWLGVASVLVALVAAAWIFLPDFRFPGYMGMIKNWPSGFGSSPHDPDLPL